MTAPTLHAADSTTVSLNTGAVGEITCDRPGNVSEGDLLVAFLKTSSARDVTSWTWSGWTLREVIDATTSSFRQGAVWTRVAGPSEPASYTFTAVSDGSDELSRVVMGIVRITGHDPSEPVHVSAVDSSTSDLIAPSVTTTVDDCLILRTWGSSRGVGEIFPPSGVDTGFSVNQGTSTGRSSALLGFHDQPSAGAAGTSTATSGSSPIPFLATLAIAPSDDGDPDPTEGALRGPNGGLLRGPNGGLLRLAGA